MEGIVLLLVIGILLFIVGLPLWILSRISNLEHESGALREKIDRLENHVKRLLETQETSKPPTLQSTPEWESSRVSAATPEAGKIPVPTPVATPPPMAEPPPPVTIVSQTVEPEPTPAVPPIIPPVPPVSPVTPAPAPPRSWERPSFNWEQFMGVKLFAWVGGFAAFLFVALGLKYSFEHNLIPPLARVIAGFIGGIGFVVGGVLLSRRAYAVLAQTLCATGVVILYAVAFSAHSIYRLEFFTTAPTFAIMVAVTVTAFLLAVRLDAMVVAILGMLGGFLTPILISTGQDNPLGLFGYIAFLDAGLVAVILNRRWNFLVVLAAAGTIFMQFAWVEKFFTVEKIGVAQGVFLVFCGLFLAASCLAKLRSQNDRYFSGAALLLPIVTAGFVLYLMMDSHMAPLGGRPGALFTLVFVADLCVLGVVLLEERLFLAHLVAGMVVFGLLGLWMSRFLSESLLYWALGLSLVFAVLHSGMSVALRRWRPGVSPVWWANLFPAIALVLVMVPIFKLPEVSLLVWCSALLIDSLAIALAVLTGSLLAIAAVLVLTLFATAVWIAKIPAEMTGDLPTMLLVVGGFSIFFFVIGLFAAEKIVANLLAEPGDKKRSEEQGLLKLTPGVQGQLPAMAAILPFLLLVMIVARLRLETPSPVFALAALLVVLALGLARVFRFEWLPAAALAGVFMLEHAWHFERLVAANASASLAWYGLFYALFLIFPFVFWRRFSSSVPPWAISALSGPLHFYLIYHVVLLVWPNSIKGLTPAAFVLPSLAGLSFLVQKTTPDNPCRKAQLAWFAGVSLFFITLIFPIQFEREWITLGWALEGAALLWLFHRVPHDGLRLTGLALLVIAFVRLGLNPAVIDYHLRTATPILNWYLYAFGVGAACMFVGANLMAPPRNVVRGIHGPPILYTLGTILLFLLLNIEIADYFSTGEVLTFDFSGNFARDMSYTIGWSVFAFILLLIGVTKKVRSVRYTSLGLLTVTVLKLFVHDLSALGQLYRLGALVSVAVIAMLASFIYQRFLNKSVSPSGSSPAGDKAAEGRRTP